MPLVGSAWSRPERRGGSKREKDRQGRGKEANAGVSSEQMQNTANKQTDDAMRRQSRKRVERKIASEEALLFRVSAMAEGISIATKVSLHLEKHATSLLHFHKKSYPIKKKMNITEFQSR